MAGTQMQQRRGTAAQWTAANKVLAAGEIGVEADTLLLKVGNGTTPWNALPYTNSAKLGGKDSGDYALKADAVEAATPVTTVKRTADGGIRASAATDQDEVVILSQLASFGRDRGTGAAWPTTDLRRGDVYYHTAVSQLGVYTGAAWRLIDDGNVATVAARNALGWAYPGMRVRVAADNVLYELQSGTVGWTKPWSLPWGSLGDIEFSASGVNLGTGFSTMAQMPGAILPGARRIRATGKFAYYTGSSSTGTIRFRLSLYRTPSGGATVTDDGGDFDFRIGGNVGDILPQTISRTIVTTGTGVQTWQFTCFGMYVNGLGSPVYRIWTPDESRFYLEDLGPVGAPLG